MLKGQSHEIFELRFFFIKRPPIGISFTPCSFEKSSQFAKIFEFPIVDDTAESMKINFCTWSSTTTQWCQLSGVTNTAESKLSIVINTTKSKLSGVIDTVESVKTLLSQFEKF